VKRERALCEGAAAGEGAGLTDLAGGAATLGCDGMRTIGARLGVNREVLLGVNVLGV